MKKTITLIFSLCVSIPFAQAPIPPNSLRIAHIAVGPTTDSLPAGFLRRAEALGYTHVMAEYDLVNHSAEWNGGYYVGNGSSYPMIEGLTDAFRQTDAAGLKLIPIFQLSSAHSGVWRWVDNPNIDWELKNFGSGTPPLESNMNALAPDANGIDRSFGELIDAIKTAYDNASLPYPLEYINIGHDEPYCGDTVACIPRYKLLAGQSSIDSAWMAGHPATGTNSAVELLMANQIARRVTRIRSVLPSTRVLIYADILDVEGPGDCSYHIPNLIRAPDLQDTAIRNNLVLIPWQYEATTCNPSRDYDTRAAFQHFVDNGYAFVFGNALVYGNQAITPDRVGQLNEFMNVAGLPQFRRHSVGFSSSHWLYLSGGTVEHCLWNNSLPALSQLPCFKTMEILSNVYHHRIGEWQ